MTSSIANQRNTLLRKQQSELKRLSEGHKNELDKIRNIQTKQKNEMQFAHKIELSDIRSAHDAQLQKTLIKNEETLQKAKDTLEKSKEVIADEKRKVQNSYEAEKKELENLHSVERRNAVAKNQLVIEEINQEGNIETQKLQREINQKRFEQKNNQKKEEVASKDIHDQKIKMTKNTYQMQQTREQDKFQHALLNQKKFNKNLLTSNERKHHKTIETRNKVYQTELNKIDQDGLNKKINKKKEFEKAFSNLNKKQEATLRNLVGKKEKIINKLRSELTKEYKLGIEKSKDPFYSFSKINAEVSELPDQSGYKIIIPLAQHEAKNLDMRAEQKELRLTMERKYEFHKEDDNSNNKISKVESFVSKIPVKDFIDPKTIQKKYEDGKVIYTIKKA